MTSLGAMLKEDLRANRGDPKGQFVVACYRIAHAARQPLDQPPRWWAVPVGVGYRVVVEWVLGIEIPWRTRIGRRLRVLHGVGLVVNHATVLGDDVVLRQGVTLGNQRAGMPCPIVADGVRFGANAVVIGGVMIGHSARIGAGAVVTKDVPADCTAVGNPARIRNQAGQGTEPARTAQESTA